MKKPKPHNPDGLSPEQVNPSYPEYRLLDADEIRPRKRISWAIHMWVGLVAEIECSNGWSMCGYRGKLKSQTYRTTLSRAELAKLK